MNVDDLTTRFGEMYGSAVDGVWAAPGRVNLIGEHTDYVGGFVLPLALPQHTLAAVALRDDDVLRFASTHTDAAVQTTVSALAPGAVTGWATYPAGVVWTLREAGYQVRGMDVLVTSTVPIGSGLSSSAALECSVALAVDELAGYGISRPQLALLCQHAENAYVGMPSGVMDQMASLCCTEGNALFLDCRSLHSEPVPFALAENGLELLVVDTRSGHRLMDGAYADRRMSVEEAAMALGVRSLRDVPSAELGAALDRLDERLRPRTRHVVTENARVEIAADLMRGGDYAAVGQLMSMSHRSLRDDYEVSSPELDAAVDASLAAGALGARMTGGGFGGCAIALIRSDQRDVVEAAVTSAYRDREFRPPRFFQAIASPGAQRVPVYQ